MPTPVTPEPEPQKKMDMAEAVIVLQRASQIGRALVHVGEAAASAQQADSDNKRLTSEIVAKRKELEKLENDALDRMKVLVDSYKVMDERLKLDSEKQGQQAAKELEELRKQKDSILNEITVLAQQAKAEAISQEARRAAFMKEITELESRKVNAERELERAKERVSAL